jgi:hypothetical protein
MQGLGLVGRGERLIAIGRDVYLKREKALSLRIAPSEIELDCVEEC